MEANELCQYLDWESDFFDKRIARVVPNQLYPETVEFILNWCNIHQIDCLFFLCESTDKRAVRLAEENGFRFMDIRVTLERGKKNFSSLGDKRIQGVVRPSVKNDIPVLRDIARVSYHLSRFYYDSNFPSTRVDAFYETWIEKSCTGYADAVLVIEVQGQIAGYISCHILDQANGNIGLLGVGLEWQGIGMGQALVDSSLRWFTDRGITCVTVVTQGRNYKARRLYERCGFLTRSVQLWYHRWFMK